MSVFAHSRWFYEQFSELASHIHKAAKLLDQLFSHPERSGDFLEALARHAAEASELRDRVVAEIEDVPVTPLPREDVHRVASMLGDTVHRFNDAAHRTRTLHLGATPPGALQMSAVLVRAAVCIETTVGSFRQRDYPTARCEEMEQLNDEARDIYARSIEALFAGHPDPLEVLRWKEVYDELDRAVEQCRAMDHELDGIVLDNRG
ncbi:DUF47 domain-containing protein [Longimicrobium sp.]|uniref:DUF47 domain-containing protein n=1 Tax=Longimicrobium sp. TaxID=2029185 RepID=UPI003B3A8C16